MVRTGTGVSSVRVVLAEMDLSVKNSRRIRDTHVSPGRAVPGDGGGRGGRIRAGSEYIPEYVSTYLQYLGEHSLYSINFTARVPVGSCCKQCRRWTDTRSRSVEDACQRVNDDEHIRESEEYHKE